MVKSPDRKQHAAAASRLDGVVKESCPSSCKYKGVRKRKWGKYVSEIRLPNCRDRIWLGSYDAAEKAARAFDAALFCLRGPNAKFNFPDNPPDIDGGRSMTQTEIQVAAARFAHSGRVQDLDLDSQSDSLSSSEVLQHVESPCLSVSDGAAQRETEFTEIPLDTVFLDPFLDVAGGNNITDFGLFPGFDDFSGDYLTPPLPSTDYYYWPENNNEDFSSQGSFLWNF